MYPRLPLPSCVYRGVLTHIYGVMNRVPSPSLVCFSIHRSTQGGEEAILQCNCSRSYFEGVFFESCLCSVLLFSLPSLSFSRHLYYEERNIITASFFLIRASVRPPRKRQGNGRTRGWCPLLKLHLATCLVDIRAFDVCEASWWLSFCFFLSANHDFTVRLPRRFFFPLLFFVTGLLPTVRNDIALEALFLCVLLLHMCNLHSAPFWFSL